MANVLVKIHVNHCTEKKETPGCVFDAGEDLRAQGTSEMVQS